MVKERLDIIDRRDVACLVNVFYDHIRADDVLGPIFDDIAHVDWPTHLPLMYGFWESVLFGTATFKGAPLEAHRALARRTPLTSSAFERWIALSTRRWMISLPGSPRTTPSRSPRESPWSCSTRLPPITAPTDERVVNRPCGLQRWRRPRARSGTPASL